MCLLIVRAEYHIKNSDEWNFKITGYDPRDLLRGHYLRFRIAYNWDKNNNSCTGSSCCLCLTETEDVTPLVHKTSCEVVKTSCDGYVLSEHQNSLTRFYIPETEASRAEDILREAQTNDNAFIKTAINANGEPKILDLMIGEKSLNEILEGPKN